MSHTEDEELEPSNNLMLQGNQSKVNGVDSYVIYSPVESSTGLFDSKSELDEDLERYIAIEDDYAVNLENNR